jgi:hypothetical protein
LFATGIPIDRRATTGNLFALSFSLDKMNHFVDGQKGPCPVHKGFRHMQQGNSRQNVERGRREEEGSQQKHLTGREVERL